MSQPAIEVFPATNPPKLTPYGEMIETVFVKGNMGGLVVIKLKAGEIPPIHMNKSMLGWCWKVSLSFSTMMKLLKSMRGRCIVFAQIYPMVFGARSLP